MKTTVKINKTFTDNGKLKGVASANFDNCFAVTGIRIIDSRKGLFVSMPNRKVGDNEYKDICFPVTKEFREEFNNAVLAAYHQKMEESQENENKDDQEQSEEDSDQESDADPVPEEEQDTSQEDSEEYEAPEESGEPVEMEMNM